ncbi:MAG: phosphate signaling complex protein PhoU [Planctomycetes bacterium]|nr:phosphate signaling complex protein PhoU [Planctomycetota bacterium]
MSLHLRRDTEQLKKDLLTMGGMVEQMVNRSIQALRDRDRQLAEDVIAGDKDIDLWEVQVEEECLKMLALHQPVASDLRFIAAVLKINTDLERMADLAVNIAELAAFLATKPPLPFPEQLDPMTEAAMGMVGKSLEAFVTLNAGLARQVLRQDDYIDQMNREVIDTILRLMQSNPDTVERAIRFFSVSRHLERIADHATNIAEDVIYMVEGEIVRHHPERI